MHHNVEFYENINKDLKEILNYPVPQILLKENRELIKELEKKPDYEFNLEKARNIALNYLLKKPLSYVSEMISENENYDFKIGYKNTEKTHSVKLFFPVANTIPFQTTPFKTTSDYIILIIPNSEYNILIFDGDKLQRMIQSSIEEKIYPIINNTENIMIPYDTIINLKIGDILLKRDKV